MSDTVTWKKGTDNQFLKLLEDFADYFINICQSKAEKHILYLSSTLLHRIHVLLLTAEVNIDISLVHYARRCSSVSV